MKKLLALFLAITMLLCLSACSTSENASGSGNGKNEGSSTSNKITFEEMTVVDNDSCTVKITGLDPDNFWGYSVNVFLENKTTDKTLMFSVPDASVNGVVFAPFFATEVAPGKKANETISFMDKDLKSLIGDFTDIELSFRVYDSSDWMAEPVAEISSHVYPYGEDKAVTFTRETLSTDVVLLDNEYVTMLLTDFEVDEIWGYTANLFLVNKTDVSVMFSADDVSVNGYMIDPFYADSVSAGKCAFSEITWSEEDLAENDIAISDINTIEMTIRAYNYDNWMAEDFANETVTVNP